MNDSFFEKLTGAVKVPENEGADDEQQMPIQQDYVEHEQAVQTEVMSKKQPLSHGDEEEEGQLTIDVYQTPEGEIVIKSPVAGVNPKDLDVTITNDMITIKGRRTNEDEVKKEDYFFQELYWGPFSRSVILPAEIEVEQAKAILKDGILTIRLPKIEKENAKKLSIEMG